MTDTELFPEPGKVVALCREFICPRDVCETKHVVVCGKEVKSDLYKKLWFPFNMDDFALKVKRPPGSIQVTFMGGDVVDWISEASIY